jgi:hypothetical protein
MTLLNQSTQVYAQLPKFLETLRLGTAPQTFTRQFLKDIGFKSSNHHQFIPLLKGLGFLTPDGSPTERYKQFLDSTKWSQILAEAVREAYGDVFVLKAKPTNSDLNMIAGKFKSTYNLSEVQAERSARTFLALLNLSDPETLYNTGKPQAVVQQSEPPTEQVIASQITPKINGADILTTDAKPIIGLHYNIQIHLPATKDLEVYNAIFKSLRNHLID